jgi:KUP system potassium uptake protein
MAALMLGAVGVVYGDIGTSPLYTLREAFNGRHPLDLTSANVLGLLSVIFWSLVIVVTLKYVTLIMRADNNGEGGILALTALVSRGLQRGDNRRWWLVGFGIFGAAMFYGDGMITPAISVLSAVEGLEIMAPALHPFIVPVTVVILVGLFAIQKHGTASVGAFFGPVVCVWFVALAALGVLQIVQRPAVLGAVNPYYAFQFVVDNPRAAFLALGAVVLAVTGTEALYADMGHFGRTPIRRSWLFFVMPALVLNYFGQGALVLAEPAAIKNPFYLLAPSWALFPLVILATCATIIASQAVISGAFSMTRAAIQMGYCPRLSIQHTSEREIGQIYVPFVNWTLLAAVLLLVLGFRSSSALAGAYGIAVTLQMLIDSILIFFVMRMLWRWSLWLALAITVPLAAIDLAYLTSTLLKIPDGGWFPLVIGGIVFTLLTTWKRGRAVLMDKLSADALPLREFIDSICLAPPTRVEGTAVFMTSTLDRVPHALLHNLKHNKVLHERVVFLTIVTRDIPYVPDNERVEIRSLGRL